MPDMTLAAFVKAAAEKFAIPGVAVAMWADSTETYACHGVTSPEDPRPVDENTLYSLGSISKTFTATTMMRLVAQGKADLDAPVRRYVPELVLRNEEWASEMTVLNLLNHTAGLDWRLIADTGDGDDALAEFVARLVELEQLTVPGTRTSYSQVGYNLVGRIIEKVTGLTFERAVETLVLEPLGLSETLYAMDDIMTRPTVAMGHNADENGEYAIARQWKDNRANNPGGGIASSVADQLRWARFHLSDGHAPDGTEVLPTETLHQMRVPTAELHSSTLGDAIGIGWFLRDVDGVRTVGHGGSGNGQFAELLTVPERDFAIVVASNASPTGIPCNQAIVRWALEHYLGVADRDPEPEPYDEARAAEIVGAYENDAMTFIITTDGTQLSLEVLLKPEIRAASQAEMPADYDPFDFGLLPGNEYVVTSGALKGQRGFFTRDESSAVVGVDLAGRLFKRLP
ncbi:MAG TPA: serine hydrolase domain-containing protein [Streptosporangiaceae bacterium]|nr:serine hydrolase domain-containing protein [Streptosporangiaceae bacterium]